jgi:pyruvate formate lyase activating enzyme
MIIGGFQKSSLIDFPEKISAIIFTQGCNFRCRYCHNPELLNYKSNDTLEKNILDFLQKRKGKLDGIVITGGEPTLQEDLESFIKKIREYNFSVKLDTNGSNPNILDKLIQANLIDYVAMDIKAPLTKYERIINKNIDIQNIKQSIDIIKKSNIKYEFRTTVLKKLLTIEDLIQIGKEIKGADKYYLQKFVPTKIYDETLRNEQNYSDEEFLIIKEKLKEYIKRVEIR